jgi:hypothetical protein
MVADPVAKELAVALLNRLAAPEASALAVDVADSPYSNRQQRSVG